MATIPDLDATIYTALSGAAGVTALVSTKIYAIQAPAGTALPYVTFEIASGLIGNVVPRDTINYVVRVHAWASTRAAAASLSGAIYTALHETAPAISGWNNYWTVCDGEQRFVENVSGTQIYHFVWDVRIKANIN